MKNIILSFGLLFFIGASVCAQSPQAFKYQTVARDLSGDILSNQNLGFQIHILQDSTSGSTIYSETFNITSNFLGLANLEIGKGSVVTGNFSTIDWGSTSHFIKVEMDETGGTTYILMGVSELLSVPYAIHANTVENELWTESNDNIYYNSGWVGIGATSPTTNLHIYEDLNSQVALKIQNPNTGTGASERIYFGTSTSVDAGIIMFGGGSSAGKLRIFNNRPSSNIDLIVNGGITMTLSNDRNVGIGVTNPIEKLEVDGKIKVTDAVKFNDNTEISTARFLPIAYGTVSSSGTLSNGSSNVTSVKNGNVYEITIAGETFNHLNYNAQVTPWLSTVFSSAAETGSAGAVGIRFKSYTGSDVSTGFYFVIWKY